MKNNERKQAKNAVQGAKKLTEKERERKRDRNGVEKRVRKAR